MKPKVFVASSSEGLKIANAIQELLDQDADVSPWYQGIFELSSSTLDDLISALDTFDFGIFVFSPDDVLKMRGAQYSVVRDNVLFEFGLFIGRLGKKRNYMILPQGQTDLRLPSDLIGLTPATYDAQRANEDILGALGAACSKLRRAFEKMGPIDRSPKKLIVPETTPRQLLVAENPREAFITGMEIVRSPIAKAFGPYGIYISISTDGKEAGSHRNSFLIARAIRAMNPLEERGIAHIRRIAEDVRNFIGDGVKTAVLVSHSIIRNGQHAIDTGIAPKDLVYGIKRAIDLAIEFLTSESKPIRGEDLLKVAITAAVEKELASLVVDAIDKVGKDGILSAEISNSEKTSIEIREGMRLDRGYLSDRFMTDPYTQQCVLKDCYILIYERRISSFRDNLELLEQIAKEGKSLLIIAEDVDGEALPTMVVNKLRGTLSCAAVKAPSSGEFRRALLQDIAILTGGKAITDDLGLHFGSITKNDFGHAKEIVIDSETTTIFEGSGSMDSIEGRVKSIRAAIGKTTNSLEINNLQARLANLVGGVAVIRVGGMTQEEVGDNVYKVASAMYATKAAIEEGYVPGGGAALFHSAQRIEGISTNNESEIIGARIVSQALREPITQIISNSSCDANVLLEEISRSADLNLGFNADTRNLEDLKKAGVLDSSKVLRRLLEVSFSHIKLILQIGDWNLNTSATTRLEEEFD